MSYWSQKLIANKKSGLTQEAESVLSDYRANRFCTFSIVLIDLALLVHLYLVSEEDLNVQYTYIELVHLCIGMGVYAITVIFCFLGQMNKDYHKHVLIGGMIAAGAFLFAVLGEDGGVFILFPMFAAGLYYSKRMCIKTYIHLFVLTIVDMIIFFHLDIHYLHYYGLTWDFPVMILNYIVPELVYLSVVFVFALLAMRNGRILLKTLVKKAEETTKKEVELNTCAEVQRSALPSDFIPPAESTIDLSAGICSAYETAGDYYDYFMIDDDRLVALVADVSDKGLGSAMYMMSVRNTIRSMFSFTDNLRVIFDKTNEILCGTSDKEFVTIFLIKIDILTGKGEFINAGHNFPILIHSDNSSEAVESEPQVIMGMFEDTRYVSYDIQLEDGDILCMYTDGIPDSLNSDMEEYGTERLISKITEAREKTSVQIKDLVLSDVEEYADITKFVDDRTLLLIKKGS